MIALCDFRETRHRYFHAQILNQPWGQEKRHDGTGTET